MSSASSASAASSATLNIVELIEKNPITKLSQKYNNLLIAKLQENFSTFEQQLFVSSFYCYLNYDKNTDFVVDLDDVWRWLGFTQKVAARLLIESNFKISVDYKIATSDDSDETNYLIHQTNPVPTNPKNTAVTTSKPSNSQSDASNFSALKHRPRKPVKSTSTI